jgi:hypothetical protein
VLARRQDLAAVAVTSVCSMPSNSGKARASWTARSEAVAHPRADTSKPITSAPAATDRRSI